MTRRKWLLAITGAASILFGLFSLTLPGNLAATLQLQPLAPPAFIELRAAYGGMFLGLGLFYLCAAYRAHYQLPALWSAAALIGGLAAGRVIGFIADGSPDAVQYGALVFEIVVLSVIAWSMRGDTAGDGHHSGNSRRAVTT
ncbi:DUF4345 domain-containing protein [Exilibacterium tricleocarpae]|uniref:DUF4345 domain-containing protein n=1 Tax=Exilibacterium tricleocarpae TaxID=2591008 RepID=A0A545U5B3_9GAMM|nr:DUF4345 domain-containing protein [Exilibacterium tricleocarpae]TQV84665.1 DUF4345 domain-containing protein [Exilibacterium tricleocarpae]